MNVVQTDRGGQAPVDEQAPPALGGSAPSRWWTGWPTWAALGAVSFVVAGVALRLWSPSALWLDEVQAVAISKLPVAGLLDALRQDGAPPLYYLILHGWIGLFGTGTTAVRALSAVFSVASLGLAWRAGEHLGGRRVAAISVLLVATSPFAIRYGSETRMYSMLVFLVLAGLVLLLDPTRPRPLGRLVAVSAVVAALVLTHYWSFFIVAAVALPQCWRVMRRPADRAESARLLAAVAAGVAPFLVWVPSFLVQVRHTGAPWGVPSGTAVIELTIRSFAGGETDAGRLLEVLLFVLGGGAVVTAWTGPRRGRVVASGLAGVVLVTLLLGAAATRLSGDAFAPRHATVALPPLLLAVAATMAALEPPRVRRGVVALAAALGLVAAWSLVWRPRTQAPEIARVLNAQVRTGDIVATCPDQLAPAINRLAPGTQTILFPIGSPTDRIDWTDYRARVKAVDPEAFAQTLDRLAGPNAVWLVWSPKYTGVGPACARIQAELVALRPEGLAKVRVRSSVFESGGLWYAPPA